MQSEGDRGVAMEAEGGRVFGEVMEAQGGRVLRHAGDAVAGWSRYRHRGDDGDTGGPRFGAVMQEQGDR